MPCPSRILCRECLTWCPATSSRQIRCPTCAAQHNRDHVKAWRAANPAKRAALRKSYFSRTGYLRLWHAKHPGRKAELERARYHRDSMPWLRAKRRCQASKAANFIALIRCAISASSPR